MTKVLRESGALPEGRVTAIPRIPDTIPGGYNGKLVRFRLILDREVPGAPETVAAKFPPDDQTMVTRSGALAAELGFYTGLAPSTPIPTPRCFFGGLEPPVGNRRGRTGLMLPDSTPPSVLRALLALSGRVGKKSSRRFLLLLEDLSDKRFGDPYAGCTEEEAAEVLRVLAALHARYWDDHSLEREPWLPKAFSYPQFIESQFNRSMQGRSGILEAESEPLIHEIAHWLRANAAGVIHRLAAFPQTLIHGDPHLDNVYFSEGRAGLVDWQTVQVGVGLLDVARFMIGSLDDAADIEEDLLRGYHTELVRRGVLDFSFDHCQQAYQLSKIYYFLSGALAEVRIGDRDRRFAELYEIGGDRFRGALPENFRQLLRP